MLILLSPWTKIAYAADGLACLFPFYGPDMIGVEKGADNFQAFLLALVGWPTGTGTHLGVTGVFEECRSIAFAPRTQ